MLELTGVHQYYGGVHVLKGLDLRVDEGEVVALIGANGAGKTTTLRAISGLLRPRSGDIVFQGTSLRKSSPHAIARLGIGHVLEGRHLFPHLSVLENLKMGGYLQKDADRVKGNLEQAFGLFPRLEERVAQEAGTLSGGEQQMLAIARALMSSPKLLLMDEPSVGLAPIIVKQIFAAIVEISRRGSTILLVEQNAQIALGIADRGYVIELGEIVLSDSGEALLKSEDVQKAYLGKE